MPNVNAMGQAGLQGWREKVADGVAAPVSKRTPLGEDHVRALLGATFFVLSVVYVVKTVQAAVSDA
jgi:hypothetical protein